MGKRQHSKDTLYLRASEWKYERGGRVEREEYQRRYKRLPFDCCALSLRPFENPVATPEGIVFDIVNIVPYIKKHKKNPVTGEPLKLKQLKKLNYHKNSSGKYHCPLTFKEFSEHTHIVAVWTSGNVYAMEAIDELNFKPKHMVDLVSGQPFKRKDVVSLQDPHDFSKSKDVTSFLHLKKKKEKKSQDGDAAAVGERSKPSSSGGAKTSRDNAAESSNSEAGATPLSRYSSAAHAASFTSTALTPVLTNARRAMTDTELREERYKEMRGQKGVKPGYIQLKTTLGELNIMLHTAAAPRTCHNFLRLCETGYYKGVTFHRVIPGFMIQGGDPTATGRGGRSAWGGKFEDEFDPALSHDRRGVISMANSGPNSNGSQFFILFGPAKHLDKKHSVFGEVVGGLSVLDKLEQVPTDTDPKSPHRDRPKTAVRIIDTAVFQNPFSQPWVPKRERDKRAAEAKAREEQQRRSTKRAWFSAPEPKVDPVRAGIGKYMSFDRIRPPKESEVIARVRPGKKRKVVKTNWGNFANF